MYRNDKGYSDPTAGVALSNVCRDVKRERRKRNTIKQRPKVYVVSKFSGDIKSNMKYAAKCCRFVAKKSRIPIASHLMYPVMGFRDSIAEEREMCCMFGLALLSVCDEVWCFTVNGEVSEGMQTELDEAKHLKIPIKYFNSEVSK